MSWLYRWASLNEQVDGRWWMGQSVVDETRLQVLLLPIPLNWVVGLANRFWWWMRRGTRISEASALLYQARQANIEAQRARDEAWQLVSDLRQLMKEDER